MIRGFSTSGDVVPNFLQSRCDDGRFLPAGTRTVTAPQALAPDERRKWASLLLAERLQKDAGGDIAAAVDLGYRVTICRPPSPGEKDRALTFIQNDPKKMKGLAWLLFNLDEFVYVR